jgi:hypothetical protein
MDIKLPEIKKYNPISITNFYGANYVALKYMGLGKSLSIINRYWSHGWIMSEKQFHPEVVLSEPIVNKSHTLLVGRVSQKEYLKDFKYKSLSIGLPFCYIEKIKLKRVKNSLLIMPAHSTADIPVISSNNKSNLLNYSLTQKDYFKSVVVCLHHEDFKLGSHLKWKEAGFDVIIGASVDDSNALNRMYHLFTQFEVVLSDVMGSHIVYAASVGAKISMRLPQGWRFDFSSNPFYSEDKSRIGSDSVQYHESRAWKDFYNFLFCDPVDAKTHIEWGQEQIGYDNKLSPDDLKDVLGWSSPRFECELLAYNGKRVVNKIRRMADSFISIRNS